jgi:hypothetical protein
MLRRKLMITFLIALIAEPAFADLHGVPIDTPVFTHEETVIIRRNATLSEVSKTNPWIVRKLFDAVEQSQPDKTLPPAPSDSDSANPDLDQMQRASPEAVHDLFQLLKQAGEKKATGPRQ